VDDLDPIRQLQHLLDDPGKLLEKISSIQSALGSIRAPDSTRAEESVAPTSPADKIQRIPMAPNRRYSRALQTLNEIKAQLEERLLPLGRALAQAEVEQLRERARQERTTMNECLAQVDRRMLACLDRIHESMRSYSNLTVLNQKLATLDSAAEPLPDFVASEDPAEIIQGRLDALRRKGKI
jgi:molecular chaperone GrpE (heat shock protein)